MLGGLKIFARAAQSDLALLKARMTTAAICYTIAGAVFTAALGLGGASAIILLVERFGLVAGLALGAAILIAVGLAALAVNAALRLRHRRLKRHATAMRSAALANAAAEGAESARHATPALLPAAAILAFALTNALLKPSRSDR
jgi:hypothetical protein